MTLDALMQIAMDRLGAYGDYFGTRLGDTLDSNVERAATAAKLREALS